MTGIPGARRMPDPRLTAQVAEGVLGAGVAGAAAGAAASLLLDVLLDAVLAAPELPADELLPLLRKSVTYRPEPLS